MRHQFFIIQDALEQAHRCAGEQAECRKWIDLAQVIVKNAIDEPVLVVKEKSPIADLIDKMT